MPTKTPGVAGGAPVPAYFMLRFNKKGREVDPGPGNRSATDANPRLVSTAQIVAMIEAASASDAPFTDVFIVSHGWMANKKDAIASYNSWLAVTKQEKPATLTSPTFRSLIVAIHWPSKPHLVIFPWISFFRMKARAETIGQNGVAHLISRIQNLPGQRHIHVMGHSFGAKVVAEAISMNGDPETNRKAKRQFNVAPVASMFLLEGAFSTWSFAGTGNNPYGTSIDGSVASVFDSVPPKVAGVAVAGTSRWDYALHRVFPGGEYIDMLGQRIRAGRFPFGRTRTRDKAIVSLVGAVGAWGFSRDPGDQIDMKMGSANGATPQVYGFQPYPGAKRPYHLIMDDVVNLDPTTNIVTGDPETWDHFLSGAHSNIAHPEVARAFWEAVTASRTTLAAAAPESRTTTP